MVVLPQCHILHDYSPMHYPPYLVSQSLLSIFTDFRKVSSLAKTLAGFVLEEVQ